MKKYGLQLRIPPAQQKQKQSYSKAPIPPPPPFAFKDDDDGEDEDAVEREISRQAAKTKSLQKVEEQYKKALEEDSSVFDYDGVYDEMKEKVARRRIQDKTERKSKYIETLMQKAKEREREHEIVYEKRILKERSKEDHLFADKEKFVTSAYKQKLAERAKWLEEERLRQIREEKDDVTKKEDLSEFYFGLSKNVAFGAGLEEPKPSKQEAKIDSTQQTEDGSRSEASSSIREGNKVRVEPETHQHSNSQVEHDVTKSKAPVEDRSKKESSTAEEKQPSQTEEQSKPTAEVYKRGEDAVAAARERFLARKRARERL